MSKKMQSSKVPPPSTTLLSDFELRTPELLSWETRLERTRQAKLRNPDIRKGHALRVYLDSFYRLKETSPLILAAVQRLNSDPREQGAVRFWSEHLLEEVNHDKIMTQDLVLLFGNKNALKIAMQKQAITPPSAVLVGYFHWQVRAGNPHLLMIFRFYLEWFASNHQRLLEEFSQNLKHRGTKTLSLHAELDPHHAKECAHYVDEHLSALTPEELSWHVKFIVEQLIEGQLWLARTILKR